MGEIAPFLILASGVAAALLGFRWLASRARRRGIGAIMNPLDEIYHPSAHQARFEIQIQDVRTVPMASADDQKRPRPGE